MQIFKSFLDAIYHFFYHLCTPTTFDLCLSTTNLFTTWLVDSFQSHFRLEFTHWLQWWMVYSCPLRFFCLSTTFNIFTTLSSYFTLRKLMVKHWVGKHSLYKMQSEDWSPALSYLTKDMKTLQVWHQSLFIFNIHIEALGKIMRHHLKCQQHGWLSVSMDGKSLILWMIPSETSSDLWVMPHEVHRLYWFFLPSQVKIPSPVTYQAFYRTVDICFSFNFHWSLF